MSVNYFEFHMDLKGNIERVDKEEFRYLIFRIAKFTPVKFLPNMKRTNTHFDISYMNSNNPKDIIMGEELNMNQLKRLYQFLELVLKDQWYDGDVNLKSIKETSNEEIR